MVTMFAKGLMVLSTVFAGPAIAGPAPDITVAADGSGDFTTVQAAVASVPRESRQRVIILVKDGVYREKIRVDASFVAATRPEPQGDADRVRATGERVPGSTG